MARFSSSGLSTISGTLGFTHSPVLICSCKIKKYIYHHSCYVIVNNNTLTILSNKRPKDSIERWYIPHRHGSARVSVLQVAVSQRCYQILRIPPLHTTYLFLQDKKCLSTNCCDTNQILSNIPYLYCVCLWC